MNLLIDEGDINISNNIDYDYEKGLSLPENLLKVLRYSTKPFVEERIVFIEKDYVAYASLYIRRKPALGKQTFEVKIDNIRRKEYYDEPISDNSLSKAIDGIKYTAEYIKYVKDCDPDININKIQLTGKWI